MLRYKQHLGKMSLEDLPTGVSLLAIATFRLSRCLKSNVSRAVSQDDDISLVSWRVLVGLSLVPNAAQKELVEFTRTEQAQLSRVLKTMERRGLIASATDPNNGRGRVFSTTPVGKQKYQTLLPSVTQLSNAMDSALSQDEQLKFLSMCERIAEASQRAGENRSTLPNPAKRSHSTN